MANIEDIIKYGEISRGEVSKAREWITHPWTFNYQGKDWDFVTDATVMVMLPYSGKYPIFEPKGSGPHNILKLKSKPIGEISLQELKEFIGAPVWETTCERCKGTGQIDVKSRSLKPRLDMCYSCEGEGVSMPPADQVSIADILFNRVLIARALSVVPEENCNVILEKATQDGGDMMHFRGDNWLITICAMRRLEVNEETGDEIKAQVMKFKKVKKVELV